MVNDWLIIDLGIDDRQTFASAELYKSRRGHRRRATRIEVIVDEYFEATPHYHGYDSASTDH